MNTCKTCKNYELETLKFHPCHGKRICHHPWMNFDETPGDAWLDVSEDDFCSAWEPREETKQ